MTIAKIIVKSKLTNEELNPYAGQFFDVDYYDNIITKDTDAYYYNDNGDLVPLFFFRKKVISDKDLKTCIDVFKHDAMTVHSSRGIASGPIDPAHISPNVVAAVSPGKFKSKIIYNDGTESKYYVANKVNSLIAGYFDKPKVSEKSQILKQHKVPCRTTVFTEKNFKNWQRIIPMIKKLDSMYANFTPENHAEQLALARLTPDYQIDDTAFSTVTVNYNWRTACHKDSGDYHNGYSVIIVAEEGKYKGGYLGYPKFGVCVDVRNGDFILKDPHQYHCNTEIIPITNDYTRLSMIFYYREKIQECYNYMNSKPIKKIKSYIDKPIKTINKNNYNFTHNINTQMGGNNKIIIKNIKTNKNNKIPKLEKIIVSAKPLPNETPAKLTLFIRPNTTDIKVIDEVLVKNVYQRPKENFYQLPGELWLDIGANIGTFSLLALSHGCNVIAYEPEQENLMLLEKNLLENYGNPSDKKRWQIIPKALNVNPGTADFYLCKGDYNKYRHTLHKIKGRQTIKVPVIAFKDEMNKWKPDGVKIDIEGAEIDILESIKPSDWAKWGTKKLTFEYSFDVDNYIPRFISIINNLKKYFKVVHYTKVKPDEEYYNHFPAMSMVYCIV